MADVGVHELKQRLSEYLDRAERGELVRVTDRGRPKALLGPLPGPARVADGVAEGWITPGPGLALRTVRRPKGSRRVLDVLDEDRGPAG
jgi:prevent-host-death family protein